ncbi:MAG: TatD family hydrolase, partial [Flavobacteriales bacterium]
MLIDTHSHLYLSQFDADRDEMLKRAKDAGIHKILLPNIDIESIAGMNAMADKNPDLCYPMMGLHPCDVKPDFESLLEKIRMEFNTRKYIAVGEIGMDMYWDKTTLDIQQKAFRIQVQWAKELQLPIVIHARD